MKKGKDTTLYAQLLAAKEEEENAIARRVELEEEIFSLHRAELKKTEGQETLENFGYKITINRPVSYKINEVMYRTLCETLPGNLQVHSIKINLDKRKYDLILSTAEKKYIKQIQNCITMTPGKVSVKVEKI